MAMMNDLSNYSGHKQGEKPSLLNMQSLWKYFCSKKTVITVHSVFCRSCHVIIQGSKVRHIQSYHQYSIMATNSFCNVLYRISDPSSCSLDFLVCFVVSETSNLYLYPFNRYTSPLFSWFMCFASFSLTFSTFQQELERFCKSYEASLSNLVQVRCQGVQRFINLPRMIPEALSWLHDTIITLR